MHNKRPSLVHASQDRLSSFCDMNPCSDIVSFLLLFTYLVGCVPLLVTAGKRFSLFGGKKPLQLTIIIHGARGCSCCLKTAQTGWVRTVRVGWERREAWTVFTSIHCRFSQLAGDSESSDAPVTTSFLLLLVRHLLLEAMHLFLVKANEIRQFVHQLMCYTNSNHKASFEDFQPLGQARDVGPTCFFLRFGVTCDYTKGATASLKYTAI